MRLNVSAAQPSPPFPPQSLFGLVQCGSESNGVLTFGCMARGFSPADSLSFKWTDSKGQPVKDFVQYPAVTQNGDNTKISHINVAKSALDPKKPYKCVAENTAGKMEVDVVLARK